MYLTSTGMYVALTDKTAARCLQRFSIEKHAPTTKEPNLHTAAVEFLDAIANAGARVNQATPEEVGDIAKRLEPDSSTFDPGLYARFAEGWRDGEGHEATVESDYGGLGDFPGTTPSPRKIGGQHPLD